MRNFLLLFIAALLLTSFRDGYKLNQGIITLQYSYPDSASVSDKIMETLPTSVTVYFKNGYTRAEYKNKAQTVVIINGETQDGYTFYGENSTTFTSTKNERRNETDLTYTYYRVQAGMETKEIAGITCKKAIITYIPVGKKEQRTIILWYTNELDVNPFDMEFKGVNGFIMEYEYDDVIYGTPPVDNFKKIMTCTNVEDTKVSEKVFKIGKGAFIRSASEIQRTNVVR